MRSLTGVSRQRCNAERKRLQESGFLEFEYGGVTVLDPPGSGAK